MGARIEEAFSVRMPACGPRDPMPFALSASLRGAIIANADSEIGFMHRGLEKIAESMTWLSARAVAERVGCHAPGMAGTCYCMAVEALFRIEAPRRARWLRTVLCEAWRICDNLMHAGRTVSHAGLRLCAARMGECSASLEGWVRDSFGPAPSGSSARIGGMARDLSGHGERSGMSILGKVREEVERAAHLLSGERCFADRTRGVGGISGDAAAAWGITGPCLRAAGIARDVRKEEGRLMYSELDFRVPVGGEGDVFDRTMQRLLESVESVRMIEQAMAIMEPGPLMAEVGGAAFSGEGCARIEASAGELSFHLFSDGGAGPYRFRVRAPSFPLCQAAPMILRGCAIEDAALVVSSLGACASEADR